MGYFIIIRGPLGCGKTTIAKKLADVLSARYVSIDELLEKYGLDKMDDPNAETIPAEHFIQALQQLLPEIREELKREKIIIFDGNFQHKSTIEYLIAELPDSNYIFTLKAPVEVCIERDEKRVKSYGEDAVRAVHMLVSRFDYGETIDVSQPLDKTVQQIISSIKFT